MQSNISIFTIWMGASDTPEKGIARKKMNIKLPAMFLPRKDPIPIQDNDRLITKKDPIIPPHLAKYPPWYKLLINDAHETNSTVNVHNCSIDNFCNEKQYSVNNMKVTNNKVNDDEYKDENSQYLNSI